MNIERLKNELVSIAGRRLQRFRELASLAEEQRSLLLNGRHSELPGNVTEHDRLLVELNQLDRREEALAGHLADAEPVSGTSADFDRKYGEINRETGEVALRLQSLTVANTELLNNAMEFVTFSIGILSKLANEQQPCDPGIEAGNSAALLLDRKV